MTSLEQVVTVAVENPLPKPQPKPQLSGEVALARTAAAATEDVTTTLTATAGKLVTQRLTPTNPLRETTAAVTAAATSMGRMLALHELSIPVRKVMRAAVLDTTRMVVSAAPVAVNSAPPEASGAPQRARISLMSLALFPVLAGALGFGIWRRRNEPFVLKAKPLQT